MSDFGTFFLPGPTEVRPDVLSAMLKPMIPHRGADFERLFDEIQIGLKSVFRTSRPVYVSSSSATGLMEASIRCARPGPILCIVNGAFSERFAQIATACGREITVAGGNWSHPVSLDEVENCLKRTSFSALTVVHSETSTGVLTQLEPLSALAHSHDCAILVDSVTGIGGMKVETDLWDLDFVLTGSQKALAMPPGLAFGVASEKFVSEAARSTSRGLYFDLMEFEQFVHRNQTPNTPALSLLYAAHEQLRHISTETVEERWLRHAEMGRRTREWVKQVAQHTGMAFSVFSPEDASSETVTAITVPEGFSSRDIIDPVSDAGFVIGSGYGHLKKSTFRIGHMGDHTLAGLERLLDTIGTAISALRARHV